MSLRDALAVNRELPTPPPDAPTPFSLADPTREAYTLDLRMFYRWCDEHRWACST